MNIERNDIDSLQATLTVNITKEDYQAKYKTELKKHAQKSQMKGFRKGKTPTSLIKKMYGKNVLVEVVNETLQTALSNYIDENKLDLIGYPLPSDDQDESVVFDINNLQDYSFKYDIAFNPTIDVKGASETDEYEVAEIEVSEEALNEAITLGRRKLGKQEEVTGAIQEDDIIAIQADELDGKKVKKDGWANEFKILVSGLNDEYKEKVLSMSTGDEFTFDIYQLEKDKDAEYVKKYLLELEEGMTEEEMANIGNMFQGKISGLTRLKPAELDQEFFDQYFGEGEVSSEEEAKEKIREEYKKSYEKSAEQLLYREISENVIEKTDVEIPTSFFKKMIKVNNEKLTDEEIDANMDQYVEGLKWSLIQNKIGKDHDIKVENSEIFNGMKERIKAYFGGQMQLPDEQIDPIVNNMLQNKEEVNKLYEELRTAKIFEKLAEKVKRKPVKMTLEEFNKRVNPESENK